MKYQWEIQYLTDVQDRETGVREDATVLVTSEHVQGAIDAALALMDYEPDPDGKAIEFPLMRMESIFSVSQV